VGFDSGLKTSLFLQAIGSFNIHRCFQFIPRIENLFVLPGVFNLKSGSTYFFDKDFRINSVGEAFFKCSVLARFTERQQATLEFIQTPASFQFMQRAQKPSVQHSIGNKRGLTI